jgi:hypothetical protein
MKILVSILFLLGSAVYAKNKCFCLPTTGKDYIGEARKHSAFGFSIHWVCDYECNSSAGPRTMIKGTYKKFYAKKSENGTEGICEGMKYVPEYNVSRGEYIYMWDNKTRYFQASKSKASEIKQWASANDCE